jgi:hypothetical protein
MRTEDELRADEPRADELGAYKPRSDELRCDEVLAILRRLVQPVPAPADVLRALDRQRCSSPPTGRRFGHLLLRATFGRQQAETRT